MTQDDPRNIQHLQKDPFIRYPLDSKSIPEDVHRLWSNNARYQRATAASPTAKIGADLIDVDTSAVLPGSTQLRYFSAPER